MLRTPHAQYMKLAANFSTFPSKYPAKRATSGTFMLSRMCTLRIEMEESVKYS